MNATKKLALSAVFLALCLVLPFLTAQLQSLGSMLLPMHFPVFLCGMICGWKYGLLVGFIAPLLRSVCFGMPHLYPQAAAMAFELAAYGMISGLIFKKHHTFAGLFAALIGAGIGGRVIWGAVMACLTGFSQSSFGWKAFVSGALLNGIPGILLQLILIPMILMLLARAHVIAPIEPADEDSHLAKSRQ